MLRVKNPANLCLVLLFRCPRPYGRGYQCFAPTGLFGASHLPLPGLFCVSRPEGRGCYCFALTGLFLWCFSTLYIFTSLRHSGVLSLVALHLLFIPAPLRLSGVVFVVPTLKDGVTNVLPLWGSSGA